MDYIEDYEVLINLMIRLVNSQAGVPLIKGSGWKNNSQTLSNKLFRHLISMKTVSFGSTVEVGGHTKLSFIDHTTVKVIARAAFETYLVFFYIYRASSDSEAEYRHNNWELGGLLDRQKADAILEEHKELLKTEKVRIDVLK